MFVYELDNKETFHMLLLVLSSNSPTLSDDFSKFAQIAFFMQVFSSEWSEKAPVSMLVSVALH